MRFCFAFRRYRVLHSARRLDMRNWNIYDLTQFVEANPGIIRRIRPRWLPSSSFSIHHSKIILQLDALNYKVFKLCTTAEQNAEWTAEVHLLHSFPRSHCVTASPRACSTTDGSTPHSDTTLHVLMTSQRPPSTITKIHIAHWMQ